MCDDQTVADNYEYLRSKKLTRRQFGIVSAGAGLSILLPLEANAQEVSESEIDVTTPDGVADCYFVHPSSSAHPGVLIWPDAFGLRPAKRQMARRLAASTPRGSTPRSNRKLESLASFSFRLVFRTERGSKMADSSSKFVDCSPTSLSNPPMTPAMATGHRTATD